MEEDRAATNLGPAVDEGIPEEPVAVPKQPKRRFVGRKTADKAGEQQADPNANIEDSSAIQGATCLTRRQSGKLPNTNSDFSRSTTTCRPCTERDSR